MASVIAERHNGRTRYRIQFRNADGKRKSIRLAAANKRTAQAIACKVEAMNYCRIVGEPPSAAASEWLVGLGDELYAKLVNAGLCEPRLNAELMPFIDAYLESRDDLSERALGNLKLTRDKLIESFGEHRRMESVTVSEALAFRAWLASQYAQATVAGHVKRSKQFFSHAVKLKAIRESPFADVVAGTQANKEREFFVTREMTQKAIDASPDAQWRLIIGLCRYGGLRCPSEILELTWDDIDWERNRFTVNSPKTGTRVVPIFPELQPLFDEAYELAATYDVHCITRYRSQNSNLRTQFRRILKRAGVPPYEKPFQNMRSSRETELAAAHPLHVVVAWIGNSERVAQQHYLQVTASDFEKASEGGATGGAASCRNAMQAGESEDAKRLENKGNAISCGISLPNQYAQQDSNLRPAD